MAVPVDWDRIASLPKVELHVHLEGSLRPSTALALGARNGVDVGCSGPEELSERYQFRDFSHFIKLFQDGLAILQTPDDYLTAADALVDELALQRVRHAEITTTPVHALRARAMAPGAYADALNQAQRRAATLGVSVRWILDISRGDELPSDLLTVGLLDSIDCPVGAVALGIGGPEAQWPPELYADAFSRARSAGFPGVVHAGEAAGAESVAGALDALHAVRIGHGVRAMEDDALVARLIDEQVPVEVCPTSNVRLIPHVAPSIEAHPVGAMSAVGINVSINSDDPAYFSTTLTRELELVATHHGFDEAALVAAQRRAIDASFAPAELRASVHAELDDWTRRASQSPEIAGPGWTTS
jgi:aminodeoxyfutalosine deaminase